MGNYVAIARARAENDVGYQVGADGIIEAIDETRVLYDGEDSYKPPF